MKLLTRALQIPVDRRGRPYASNYSIDEQELAYAYFNGVITQTQAARVLRTTKQNVMSKMTSILRSSIVERAYKLTRC